jgi:hypothetical protein
LLSALVIHHNNSFGPSVGKAKTILSPPLLTADLKRALLLASDSRIATFRRPAKPLLPPTGRSSASLKPTREH